MAGEQFKGKKYNLVKWETVCKSKKKGGLGVKNIRKMNISFLCKWWWKLETEEGLWQNIVKAKYIKGDTPIGAIKHRLDDSLVWSDLLKIRHISLKGRSLKVKNGKSVIFWEEPWLTDQPLCVHPIIYDLCLDKKITVYNVLTKRAQLNFSRWLPSPLFDSWFSNR